MDITAKVNSDIFLRLTGRSGLYADRNISCQLGTSLLIAIYIDVQMTDQNLCKFLREIEQSPDGPWQNAFYEHSPHASRQMQNQPISGCRHCVQDCQSGY